MGYDTVLISAESVKDAKAILRPLLSQRLVVGGVISQNPGMFWWKQKVVEMPYVFATVFALSNNRKKIKETVRKHSKEEVPIVTFTKIEDSTKEFQKWVSEHTVKK